MRFFQLQSQRMWCYYFLPVPYNWFSLSKNHQRVAVMNHCFYCFDGFWKVKAKYIVLCLNALAKLKNVTGTSRHSVLMGNCPTFSHMPSLHQSTKWFLIISIHVVWRAWDSVATRDIPLEKKVDMKCMQVNVLKNIAGITRILCVLIMSHMHFRVNQHSVVAWMSGNSLIEADVISEV